MRSPRKKPPKPPRPKHYALACAAGTIPLYLADQIKNEVSVTGWRFVVQSGAYPVHVSEAVVA